MGILLALSSDHDSSLLLVNVSLHVNCKEVPSNTSKEVTLDEETAAKNTANDVVDILPNAPPTKLLSFSLLHSTDPTDGMLTIQLRERADNQTSV